MSELFLPEKILLYSEFDLIIDTNQECFSFYNELCAYCTGFTDSEENGKALAELFYLEMGFEDDESSKGRVAEEKNPFHNCLRFDDNTEYETPFSIMLNKRYGANEDGQYVLLTEENCEEYYDDAPFSMAIMFDLKPTEKQIKIIKDRATKFFTEVWPNLPTPKEKVEVEGFRLITRTHYGQEVDL